MISFTITIEKCLDYRPDIILSRYATQRGINKFDISVDINHATITTVPNTSIVKIWFPEAKIDTTPILVYSESCDKSMVVEDLQHMLHTCMIMGLVVIKVEQNDN